MPSSKELTIRFKCPKCEENIITTLDMSSLDFKGGIASASLLHGKPPHVAIVYIDLNGEVRGVEVPEVTLQVAAPKPVKTESESVDVSELKKFDPVVIGEIVGKDFIERALVYIIADRPTYFVFQKIDDRFYKALEDLANIFGNGTVTLKDSLSNTRSLIAVSSSFYLKNEKEILKSCVLYTLTKKMKCHTPKSKTFQRILKQYFFSPERLSETTTVIKYYIGLTELAYDMVKRHGRVKKKDLAKLANISSKDIDAVVDCLVAKGVRLEKDLLIYME